VSRLLGRLVLLSVEGTMTVYSVIVAAALMLGSLAMILRPGQVWRFARGWRFANPEEIRLSDAYVAWLRLSGALGLVLGIGLLVSALR